MSSLTSYNGLSVLTPEPSAAGGKAINDNFKALSTAQETSNPGSSNDNTEGYSVGSRWVNTTTGIEWLCTSSATGAAVWVAMVPTLEQVTTAGATTDQAVTLSNGASFSGSNLNMNDGSGSGGGSLNLDQGDLNCDSDSGISADGGGNVTVNGSSLLVPSYVIFDLYGTPQELKLNGAKIVSASSIQATSLQLQPQTSAPSSPAEGTLYVNNTSGVHTLMIYLNGTWKTVSAS